MFIFFEQYFYLKFEFCNYNKNLNFQNSIHGLITWLSGNSNFVEISQVIYNILHMSSILLSVLLHFSVDL